MCGYVSPKTALRMLNAKAAKQQQQQQQERYQTASAAAVQQNTASCGSNSNRKTKKIIQKTATQTTLGSNNGQIVYRVIVVVVVVVSSLPLVHVVVYRLLASAHTTKPIYCRLNSSVLASTRAERHNIMLGRPLVVVVVVPMFSHDVRFSFASCASRL